MPAFSNVQPRSWLLLARGRAQVRCRVRGHVAAHAGREHQQAPQKACEPAIESWCDPTPRAVRESGSEDRPNRKGGSVWTRRPCEPVRCFGGRDRGRGQIRRRGDRSPGGRCVGDARPSSDEWTMETPMGTAIRTAMGNCVMELMRVTVKPSLRGQEHPTTHQSQQTIHQLTHEISPIDNDTHTVSLTLEQVMNKVRRVTEGEFKGYGSVFDVLRLVPGNSCAQATWRDMKEEVHDLHNLPTHKFSGQGQRNTPVAPLSTLIEIVWDCPGTAARTFRRKCADLIKRVFEGDETLVAEIRANNANSAHNANAEGGAQPQIGLSLEAENGTVVKLSPQSVRASGSAHLGAVPDMPSDIVVPRHMAHRPGAYVGVKGCFVDTAKQVWAHVKVGKHDHSVEFRTDEHALENEHWRLAWVGVVGSERCTPRMIENKLKVHAKRCPYARILVGHQGEEILVPLERLGEFMRGITFDTERVMAEDVKGMHAVWGRAGQEEDGRVYRDGQDAGDSVVRTQARGASTDIEMAKYNVDADADVQKDKDKSKQEYLLKALERGLITPDQYISVQAKP